MYLHDNVLFYIIYIYKNITYLYIYINILKYIYIYIYIKCSVGQKVHLVIFHKIKDIVFIFINNFMDLDILSMSVISC